VELKDVGMVIATRKLEREGVANVVVHIGKPEKFPGSEDYYCPFRVHGLDNEKVGYAGGVDAVQTLELALKMVGTVLYTSTEAQARELTWNGSEDLGFPVPSSIIDLLPASSKQ
jgi:hypothetical protein